jgi:hypothetical protein
MCVFIYYLKSETFCLGQANIYIFQTKICHLLKNSKKTIFTTKNIIKMQHKTKFREHFLPIRVFLNSLNNDIVESNSVVVFKNKLQKYPLTIIDVCWEFTVTVE